MALKKKDTTGTLPDAAPVDDYSPVGTEAPAPALTVNGQPIPDHLAHLIPFAQTDQGRAENNLGKAVPMVEMVRDAWDNQMLKRGDTSLEPWEAPDPAKELIDPVREPGMAYRMLSDRITRKRGRRGWEPVKGANGDPLKVGDMIIAKMPIERKEKRNRFYEDEGRSRQAEAQASLIETRERAAHDGGAKGISVLTPNDGLQDYRDPTREVTTGVSRTRGPLSQ